MLTLQVTKWSGKKFEKVTNEMYDFLLMKIKKIFTQSSRY